MITLAIVFLTLNALGVTAVSRDFSAVVHSQTPVRALVSDAYDASTPRPLLVYLHGFCASDDAQQALELTSMRRVPAVRNRLGVDRRRQQVLVQTGLREAALAEDWIYVAPQAPRTTRECVLCNMPERSPNSQDRLFASWITGIMARETPEFTCRAWDGSDAVAFPESGATDDNDVHYIEEIIEATKKQFNVDSDRIYIAGIATGGFMANRMACERPGAFRGVATFSAGTFKNASRCTPDDKTSVLLIHGTDDLTVPIDGGVNSRGVAFPSSDESFEILGDAMGCSNVISQERSTLPVDGGNAQPDVDVRKRKFQKCAENVKVEQWTLKGVDHFLERPTSEAMFKDAVAWLKDLQ